MPNNIKKDLALFNELITVFLEDELQNPVTGYINPNEVEKAVDIKLGKEGAVDNEFKKSLTQLLLKSPKSSSKLFFNQLFGGRHSKAVLGDLLAVMLNNSMATYKIAGPQVAVEKEILSQVYKLIGYDNNAGGTFPTGGSMSNFMSLVMARDKVNLEIKEKGISQKLVAYTSENSHYSLSKNASFTGLGRANIRHVKSDKYGRINVLELEKKIQLDLANGFIPLYLNATAGTTVLCAFDNVAELAPLCEKYNIWLHLDGAFGGSVIFSEKYKYLVDGVNLTNSFCFNAHKTLGAPLSTSILVVKDKHDLYNSFNNSAAYLYQTHDEYFNLGQTSFECGRRNNSLKLWTMWKAIGTNGISDIVEEEFRLAEAARNYVKSNSDYKLYSFENSLSICFNYKDFDPKDLCTKLYESNTLMVGFGHFHDKCFVRLVVVNCEQSFDDLMQFFIILEEFTRKNKDLIKKR
ncbi:MAG: aminotransferase class V-fold PLP-dependent enzyme [Bacteroidota bacterium]|nr:aminotransferase class V-fold PLP-dependent enzyme [Bacteroidota bacterium]